MNNNQRQSRNIGTVSIISAGILWGTMGLFVRGMNAGGLYAMDIVLLRSLFSALIMLFVLLFMDKKLLIIKVKDIWCFIGTGIVSLTLFNVCYFTTIQRTSMAVAAILLYTSPVFVVLMSAVLFKEKITPLKIVAMIIAFIGCVFVAGIIGSGQPVMSMQGIAIGVCSGIGYALYSIFGRYALERGYKSPTISFYTFLFATLGSSIFVSAGEATNKIINGDSVRLLLLIIGIAVVATVLPYLLYTYGLSKVENGKAAIMVSVEPVMAAVLGMIVFKEVLNLTGYIGVIMVLVAITLLNLPDVSLKQK